MEEKERNELLAKTKENTEAIEKLNKSTEKLSTSSKAFEEFLKKIQPAVNKFVKTPQKTEPANGTISDVSQHIKFYATKLLSALEKIGQQLLSFQNKPSVDATAVNNQKEEVSVELGKGPLADKRDADKKALATVAESKKEYKEFTDLENKAPEQPSKTNKEIRQENRKKRKDKRQELENKRQELENKDTKFDLNEEQVKQNIIAEAKTLDSLVLSPNGEYNAKAIEESKERLAVLKKEHEEILKSEEALGKEEEALGKEKTKLKLGEVARLLQIGKDALDTTLVVDQAAFDLFKALSEKKIAQLEREAEAEKAVIEEKFVAEKLSLDKRLANDIAFQEEQFVAGKLSLEEKQANEVAFQEKYNDELLTLEATKANRLSEIDKEISDKKLDLAKTTFYRQKVISYANAVVGTAVAVVNALATQPFFPMGLIAAATAGAAGAAQLVTIAATTPPKAARGGLIQGLSHAAGGTLIEAERGEAIINRRSTGIFAPLLSAINEAGGGVPFAAPFSDGGFTQREYQRQSPNSGITTEGIALAMSQAVAKQPIFVAVEDINTADRKYATMTDSAAQALK